eukprot:1150113-Pelagomonas_calceolata.AAC.8
MQSFGTIGSQRVLWCSKRREGGNVCSNDIAETIAKGMRSIGGLAESRWAGLSGRLGGPLSPELENALLFLFKFKIWFQVSEVSSDLQPRDLAQVTADPWTLHKVKALNCARGLLPCDGILCTTQTRKKSPSLMRCEQESREEPELESCPLRYIYAASMQNRQFQAAENPNEEGVVHPWDNNLSFVGRFMFAHTEEHRTLLNVVCSRAGAHLLLHANPHLSVIYMGSA